MKKKLNIFLLVFCLLSHTSCINKNVSEYIKSCECNIGKNVVICGKEYKIIDYIDTSDSYVLHNHELIKAEFVYGYIYTDDEGINCDSIIDRDFIN